MLVKLILGTLAVVAIALAENTFPNAPGFNELFEQIREQMKPITGGIGSGSGSGSNPFPTLPPFPSLGSFGGSNGHNRAKRQSLPEPIKEWFEKFGQGNNPISEGLNNFNNWMSNLGNGGFPLPGGSSGFFGSSESGGNSGNHI